MGPAKPYNLLKYVEVEWVRWEDHLIKSEQTQSTTWRVLLDL